MAIIIHPETWGYGVRALFWTYMSGCGVCVVISILDNLPPIKIETYLKRKTKERAK